MLLRQQGRPLEAAELPDPVPGPGEVLIRVAACGVCRTDLHVVDGDLHHPSLPLVPGHEIVGHIEALGPGVDGLHVYSMNKPEVGRATHDALLACGYLSR